MGKPTGLVQGTLDLRASGLDPGRMEESENHRRAKFYSLTAAGRKRLKTELDNWYRLSGAIGLVIEAI